MDESLVLDILLNSTNEALVITDNNGIIVEMSKSYAEFLEIKKSFAIGKHVTDVIENTRMHIVLETGEPEIAKMQNVKNQTMLATRIPIYKDQKLVGAFGRVLYKNIKELHTLHNKITEMEGQLLLYRNKYGKINEAKYTVDDIIGKSRPMVALKETIVQVAKRNSSILISGESGTGKELIAHAVHSASSRRQGPMICVNCAAIPSELLESELFGYEEGAFTGAKKGGKQGLFKAANGGTLLLDEIGDLPMPMQVKLLRVIQDKEVRKVGSAVGEAVDVRLISATNKNLQEMVSEGLFRADLYYRLNVISIITPPIRERKSDIPILIDFFLKKIALKEGIELTGVTHEVMNYFVEYEWPGNIRELENALERASNFVGDDGVIKMAHLKSKALLAQEHFEHYHLKGILEQTERETILKALSKHNDNKTATADELGISRTSLYEKIEKYKLASTAKSQ